MPVESAGGSSLSRSVEKPASEGSMRKARSARSVVATHSAPAARRGRMPYTTTTPISQSDHCTCALAGKTCEPSLARTVAASGMGKPRWAGSQPMACVSHTKVSGASSVVAQTKR
ncbi:hypothetical protein D3C85_347560 [compost metagenome]